MKDKIIVALLILLQVTVILLVLIAVMRTLGWPGIIALVLLKALTHYYLHRKYNIGD